MTQHQEVSVMYTQGYWRGELGSDIVEFPSLGIPGIKTAVAVIQTSHNFFLNGSLWQVKYLPCIIWMGLLIYRLDSGIELFQVIRVRIVY